MMIANGKRSKRSSACGLENFNRLRGVLPPRGPVFNGSGRTRTFGGVDDILQLGSAVFARQARRMFASPEIMVWKTQAFCVTVMPK
jgi:hypothetical protein